MLRRCWYDPITCFKEVSKRYPMTDKRFWRCVEEGVGIGGIAQIIYDIAHLKFVLHDFGLATKEAFKKAGWVGIAAGCAHGAATG
jgi:hypothetical protein